MEFSINRLDSLEPHYFAFDLVGNNVTRFGANRLADLVAT